MSVHHNKQDQMTSAKCIRVCVRKREREREELRGSVGVAGRGNLGHQ